MFVALQHPEKPAASKVPTTMNTHLTPRLFLSSPDRTGQTAPTEKWGVKILLQGRRHTFSLRAETKDAAAAEARIIYDTILAEGWDAVLRAHALPDQTDDHTSPMNVEYWKERLIVRRYRFPATGGTDKDWAVRIDHAGTGFWFPLGTPEVESAAAKARRIHEAVTKDGWESAADQFSRELIINFEWCSNPILWTYTTIHTLVDSLAGEADSASSSAGVNPVIIVEADAGIRRALQWCVDQQPGFCSISCASPEMLAPMLPVHKPVLILLNRSLAERVGVELSGGLAMIKPGTMALGYSVSVDGDQMFVSTPGGAEGYMLKRVKPSGLLEPISGAVRLINTGSEDFLGGIKSYFKELLRPNLGGDTSALSRLTPRENDVLALLAKGCVDKEISTALGISIWTVHGHIKKIFERLHVRTRTEAVVRYLEK